MKLFAWILVLILALALALAAPVIAWRTHPGRDCANEELTIKGLHGEEIRCVCLGGTLSTCFTPEP